MTDITVTVYFFSGNDAIGHYYGFDDDDNATIIDLKQAIVDNPDSPFYQAAITAFGIAAYPADLQNLVALPGDQALTDDTEYYGAMQ